MRLLGGFMGRSRWIDGYGDKELTSWMVEGQGMDGCQTYARRTCTAHGKSLVLRGLRRGGAETARLLSWKRASLAEKHGLSWISRGYGHPSRTAAWDFGGTRTLFGLEGKSARNSRTRRQAGLGTRIPPTKLMIMELSRQSLDSWISCRAGGHNGKTNSSYSYV